MANVAIYLIAVLTITSSTTAQKKVLVDVYYESLCPDSRQFIHTQLYPTLQGNLQNYVELNLVPFGKSTYQTYGSDTKFECHHGPNECYGNKVHACALKHIEADSYQDKHTKDSLTRSYIDCLMQNSNLNGGQFPGLRCAESQGVKHYDTIDQCANSTEGSDLLARYGDKTKKLSQPLQNVPTIVIGGQYEKETQDLALVNFRGALCSHILPPRPAECPSSGANFYLVTPVLMAISMLFSKVV